MQQSTVAYRYTLFCTYINNHYFTTRRMLHKFYHLMSFSEDFFRTTRSDLAYKNLFLQSYTGFSLTQKGQKLIFWDVVWNKKRVMVILSITGMNRLGPARPSLTQPGHTRAYCSSQMGKYTTSKFSHNITVCLKKVW